MSTGVAALILAAGDGQRLGLGPKALLQLGGRTLVQIAVDALAGHATRVLVGAPAEQVGSLRAALAGRAEVLPGGSSRLATLAALTAACHEDLLLIHDAARPFASAATMAETLSTGRLHGAAVAARRCPVPVARVQAGRVQAVQAARDTLLLETPFVLHREALLQLLACAGGEACSLSELAQACGLVLHAVVGNDENFKITTAADWQLAQALALQQRPAQLAPVAARHGGML